MAILKDFHTKVVGVSFDNSDGVNRQKILATCKAGESIYFEEEPDNPKDPKAVKVMRTSTKQQLGYLDRRVGREVIACANAGEVVGAIIGSISGGKGGHFLGCNIRIVVGDSEPLVIPPEKSRGKAERKESNSCLGALAMLVVIVAAVATATALLF